MWDKSGKIKSSKPRKKTKTKKFYETKFLKNKQKG